jgi:hypothetical protein
MVAVGRVENIGDLERHFDETLSKLRVYELPLHIALIVTLTIFEELHCTAIGRIQERFSSEAVTLHYKDALEILIPCLLKRCEQQEVPKQPLTVTKNILVTVADAFHFCERYHFVVHAYTQYHQKQFTGSLSGRIVDFQYSRGIDLGRSSLQFLLHQYYQQRTIQKSELSGMLPPSVSPNKSLNALVKQIRSTDVRAILHSMPEEVYIPIREIVKAALPQPTVDVNAKCGNYSIGDYYNLWLEFMTLMLAYRQACEEKSRIDDSFNLLAHRILRLTLPELSKMLSNRLVVAYEVAYSILRDLILDMTAPRPDVKVQPLIPMPNKEIVLIAPSLIYTTNWEVCILRNWTRLYPKKYGKVVASKKAELAKSLGRTLDNGRFIVSTNRELTNEQGRTIGEVDVAAFDPSDGLLVLFEVKWLIEPDSVRETLKSDIEIVHGIEQVLRCRRYFEKDRARFLKQVFPHDNVEISAVSELRCYVIANGNVGTKDDKENEVYVLDYLLCIDTVTDSTNISLRQILSRIVNKQIEISNSIDEGAQRLRIKLAGYLIRQPGFGVHPMPILEKGLRTIHPSRNDRCICGSGRKYKKCCLELDGYTEDVVSTIDEIRSQEVFHIHRVDVRDEANQSKSFL